MSSSSSSSAQKTDNYNNFTTGTFNDSTGNILTGGATTINQSDQGTVQASREIALAGVDTANNAVNQNTNVAKSSITATQESLNRAFNFGDNALDTASKVFGAAISSNANTTSNASQSILAATRSDSADSFNNLIKYGSYAAIAIAGVIAIIIFTRKK